MEREIEGNISLYAYKHYKKSNYTELIAECFSVMNDNQKAKNFIKVLKEVTDI